MKIGDICNRQVVTIGPDDSIVSAAKIMREQHVGDLVVTESRLSERIPVGILTDRDIVIGAIAHEVENVSTILVRDLMIRDLVTVYADEDVNVAINKMWSRGVRRMPVVNSLEALVGIVTYDDLCRWMAEQLSDFTRLLSRQADRERTRRK